jgi:hypothetical protein
MRTFIIALFLIISIGCNKETYKTSEFFLKNSCDFPIEVKSTVLVRYSDGHKEESKTDMVQGGELLSMRKIDVSESFTMKSVFSKLEIYKETTKSTNDIMNKEYWVKTSSTDNKDEYTLTVDTTFFE